MTKDRQKAIESVVKFHGFAGATTLGLLCTRINKNLLPCVFTRDVLQDGSKYKICKHRMSRILLAQTNTFMGRFHLKVMQVVIFKCIFCISK